MFYNLILAVLFLAIIVPIGVFFLSNRKAANFKLSLAVNLFSFFGVLVFVMAFFFTQDASAAEAAAPALSGEGMKYIGAALAVGVPCIGAGIAVSSAASAALGALSENEGVFGKALIFVALAEGIAIYGLIIAFMMLA